MYCIVLYDIILLPRLRIRQEYFFVYTLINIKMKKVISVGLGGYSFQMEEDAYLMLQDYLAHFKAKLGAQDDVNEVMQDIECRLAEILLEDVKMPNQVVGVGLVQIVIKRVGMPDGSNDYTDYQTTYQQAYQQPQRKLYRDPDHCVIGGVAGGLAAYLDAEIVLLRVIWLLSLLFGGLGFWAYIILWICVPMAKTPTQKLQMRGLPVTAENLLKYATKNDKK